MQSDSKALTLTESHSLRRFLILVFLVATLCVGSGYLGIALHTRSLIREEMLNSARRNFTNIVIMRRWNADHGGVYVLKRPGVESNAYLEKPDITAVDGKVYTLKNPALMTREISELLKKDEGFFFHITSLRPLNPNNQPDEQERAALTAFEQGAPELAWEQDINGLAHYRYMAPLKVEASCLACHAKQGYQAGDVRGGISVSFRMSDVQTRLHRNSLIILGLALLTISLILVFVGIFFRSLVSKLGAARATLNQMATTDQLTGLTNRHTLFRRLDEEYQRHQRSGRPLSVVMLDVDFFKSVNDTYGHAMGDSVLRQIAQQVQAAVRKYDIAARFGGEEFLLMLPDSELAMATSIAERIRQTIEQQVRAGTEPGQRVVTVSLGIAGMRAGEDKDALIQRADAALYRAKAQGRNRVVADAP